MSTPDEREEADFVQEEEREDELLLERTQKKRKIRLCRRGRVKTETVLHVATDVWLLVCKNFFFSPHCVFRLMRASKQIWMLLRNNPQFWEQFYDRIMLFQVCFSQPVYSTTYVSLY